MEIYERYDLETIRDTRFGGRYFDIDNGGVQFKDPVTDELLLPGHVPPSIKTHAALNDGVEYLKELGCAGRMGVHFLLGSHAGANDFSDIHRTARHVLDTCSVVAIEASWQQSASPNGTEVALPTVVSHESAPGRHAFQTAQTGWLTQNNKRILPCQMAEDDKSKLAYELERLWNISVAARADETLEPGLQSTIRMLAEVPYQAVRQWTIIAQLGSWLITMERQGQLDEEYFTVPIILGRWHAHSQDRLAQLGVANEAHHVPYDPQIDSEYYIWWGDMMMDATYNARASHIFLSSKLPY